MKTLCYHCMREGMENGRCTLCGALENKKANEHDLALPPGTRLDEGNIIVGEALGNGGFGITYLALDRHYGRIALKEFAPRYMLLGRNGRKMIVDSDKRESYEKCLRSFCRESRLLNKLRHPNIVHVRFELEENGTAYYGMELLEGETFAHYIRANGPMDAAEVCRMLLPIMDALIYVHHTRTLHRDISPDNIFLRKSADGSVSPCLIDFGAAFTTMKDFTQTVPGVKKKGYSPFEQNWASEHQGPFTDVYAFCATLYYAMTQKVPCPADARMQGNQDMLIPPSQLNPNIPKAVDQVIFDGMALLPKNRTQDMVQLKAQLCRAVGIAPSRAGNERPPVPENQPPVSAHAESREILSLVSQEQRAASDAKTGTSRAIAALLLDWLILWALPTFPAIMVSSVPVGLAIGVLIFLLVNSLMLLKGGTLGQQLLDCPSVKRTWKEIIPCVFLRLIIPLALYTELAGKRSENAAPEVPSDIVSNSAGDSNRSSGESNTDMKCWLYGIEGCHKDSLIELRDPLTFGRDSNFAMVSFPERYTTVSQRHCVIRYQNGWRIWDMHSRNGTYLNGKKLEAGEASACLQAGDRIRISDNIFEYRIQ